MELSEIENAIERGDVEVINDVLSGKYDGASQEAPEENSSNEPVSLEPQDQPDDNEQEENPYTKELLNNVQNPKQVDEKEIEKRIRKEYEEKLARQAEENEIREELRKVREEREQLLELMKNNKAADSDNTAEDESDDEDDEYASNYSKRTREMVKKLEGKLQDGSVKSNPEIQEFLERFKNWEETQKQLDEQRAREEAQENQMRQMRKLYNEIETFQKTNSDYHTNRPVEVIRDEVLEFKDRVGEMLGTTDNGRIELAVQEIVYGNSKTAEELKRMASQKQISVPEEFDKFDRLSKIVDYKHGRRFNPTTASFEDITDEFGNKVRYRTLEEADWVLNRFDYLSKAKKDTAREFQHITNRRNESARTLDNNQGYSQNSDKMDIGEIDRLITLKPKDYKNDPQLKAKVEQAYKTLGMEPPQKL